jgi:hypothetical protein
MRWSIVLLAFVTSVGAQEFPNWLKISGGYRARGEFTRDSDFERGANQNYFLGRFRLGALITVNPDLQFYVEGQDARSAGLGDPALGDGRVDYADFNQAWARFGSESRTWQLQIGRQELAFGDERLIGADRDLDPLGFHWDAAKLTYKHDNVQVESFAAWQTDSKQHQLNSSNLMHRLYGIYVTLPSYSPKLQMNSYLFFDEDLHHLHPDSPSFLKNRIGALGVRATGEFTKAFEYNLELTVERGRSESQAARAWAGHWELGWRPMEDDRSPRLGVEYNYASGDSNPDDHVHGTFDDLHPAGFNKFGMADPFAWRNMKNPSLNVEVPLGAKWKIFGGTRWFWLASTRDGLYTVGEEVATPSRMATSAYVGQQVNAAVMWQKSVHWRAAAGYSWLSSGSYLQQSGLNGRLSMPYVSLDFAF